MTNNMKSVQNIGYETYVTKDFHAGTDTTITVYDASLLPSAPNTVCISSLNNEDTVIVKYTAVSGNVLTVDSITHYNRPGAETTTYFRGSTVYKEFSTTVSGGSGSGTDYTTLTNKPQINSVELVGNKSIDEIGAVKADWGTAYNGKVIKIVGGVATADSVSFTDITGDVTDNPKLIAALNSKVPLSSTSESITGIGRDADGNLYVEY